MTDFWGVQTSDGKPYLMWFGPKDLVRGDYPINAIPESGADLCSVLPTKDPKAALEWFGKVRGTTAPTMMPRLLHRGQRHPRMWRGAIDPEPMVPLVRMGAPHNGPEDRAMLATATAASSLFRTLDSAFYAVEPHSKNADTYSHQLRHLLILAATEVEAGWKGVLKANGYPGSHLTTNDYVKVMKPLALGLWKVRLSFYPDYPPLRPFEDWTPADPTDSLPWYAAYHAVKHDREGSLNQATLANVITAAAALMVLAVAQFGWSAWITSVGAGPFSQGLFSFDEGPGWDADECYFPPQSAGQWEYVPYPFKAPTGTRKHKRP